MNQPPLGLYAQLACLWEATARKPGNVHRHADFADTHYLDFAASAVAIGTVFDAAAASPVGMLVLRAIEATRQVTATNTNLGIVLLLAPLARAAALGPVRETLPGVLASTTVADADAVYRAIRLASPAGLGKVDNQDVSTAPTLPLLDAMRLAEDRDRIAYQYGHGFADVLGEGVASLREASQRGLALEEAIVLCHLRLLAGGPDSLIARKCGQALAEEASRRAAAVLVAGWPDGDNAGVALAGLDAWLRADGNRRNPGTTADLVAASLFAALCERIITVQAGMAWAGRAVAFPSACTP